MSAASYDLPRFPVVNSTIMQAWLDHTYVSVELTEQMRRVGFSKERFDRLQGEPHPQFGCAGMHHGSGAPDCPRKRHHHHDQFCTYPSQWECALVNVPYRYGSQWGSRA